MMIFDSTNEDVQDSDFCAYKERVFVIGDTIGQLGDCFFGESCNDGHKYIFIATLDIPQWDVYTESTGQVVRDLLHTRFVSINRAGFTGSDDVAVDIVSGIHGGAWVLGNSNISFTTTTTSVRCVDDTSSTVPCTQGHGVLLLRTDILGQTQDAIRMQGDYLKAHALGMDVHTGSLYVFGITKSFGVCTNRLGCFSSQLHLSLIRFDDTHKNSALGLTWAVRWSSGNVPELPVSIFSLNKSGRFALVINEMGVDIDNNLTSSSCAVGQHCGSNDENVALYVDMCVSPLLIHTVSLTHSLFGHSLNHLQLMYPSTYHHNNITDMNSPQVKTCRNLNLHTKSSREPKESMLQ